MSNRADPGQRPTSLPSPDPGSRRRALLAKIHIAKKELRMSSPDYRALLMGGFGVPSATELPMKEMERLLEHFVRRGWRPKPRSDRVASLSVRRRRRQVFALQARAREILSQLEDRNERRLQGLCEKICGSRDLASCRDVGKLRRILAVLVGIRKRESSPASTLH
jgi:hypothetical protein